MDIKHRKIYVFVNLDVDPEGKIYPRSIKWEDGRVFAIDRVKDRRLAASTKVGGCGVRYTVVICGRESYLFQEDGRWFVEAKK